VRPLTYENAGEMGFLKSVYARRGSLENTSFGILTPDGETHLTRSARSPSRVFADGAAMAEAMVGLADEYPGEDGAGPEELGLPLMENVRLALNAAACDTRLLVVAYADSEEALAAVEETLTRVAWSEGVIGHFAYAATFDVTELATINDTEVGPGVTVFKPGTFGLSGELVCHLPPEATAAEMREAMLAAHAANRGYSKDSRRHVAAAARAKATWQSTTGQREERRPRGNRGRRGGDADQGRRRGGRGEARRGGGESSSGSGGVTPPEKKRSGGNTSG